MAPDRQALNEEVRDGQAESGGWQLLPAASSVGRIAPASAAVLALQRTAGNAAVSKFLAVGGGNPLLQRLAIPTPGAGMGIRVGADDDSSVQITPVGEYWVNGRNVAQADFGDGQRAAINLPAGTSGVLRIYFRLHFFLDNSLPFSNIEYDKQAWASWDVTVSRRGQITIRDGIATYGEGGETTNQLTLGSIDVAQSANYVQGMVNIAQTTQHGRSGGAGYEVSQSQGGRTFTRQFRMNVTAPQSPPEGEVTVGPISVRRSHSVLFSTNRHAISPGEQDRLMSWFQGLNDHAKETIIAGGLPMDIEGYASRLGPAQHNLELSDRRRQEVERVLRMYAGSRAHLQWRSLGEYDSQAGESDNSPEERRVTVSVWEPSETQAAEQTPTP